MAKALSAQNVSLSSHIYILHILKEPTVGQKMLQSYCKGPVTYATSLDVDQIYISHMNILFFFKCM